uniref:Uncharacterized protein n=1 Tax=Anguilla anguilla TaxID=7936 RepID=A0A0E9QVS9_ANGAN
MTGHTFPQSNFHRADSPQ